MPHPTTSWHADGGDILDTHNELIATAYQTGRGAYARERGHSEARARKLQRDHARLIAATPRLLATLREIAAGELSRGDTIARARAAIAAATGEKGD